MKSAGTEQHEKTIMLKGNYAIWEHENVCAMKLSKHDWLIPALGTEVTLGIQLPRPTLKLYPPEMWVNIDQISVNKQKMGRNSLINELYFRGGIISLIIYAPYYTEVLAPAKPSSFHLSDLFFSAMEGWVFNEKMYNNTEKATRRANYSLSLRDYGPQKHDIFL